MGRAPPITQLGLGSGAPGLGTATVPPCENAGVPLAPPLQRSPQGPVALLAPATPCCAAPWVRFPSAHNNRGNIYTVARAHLIFMGRLFIDGERLAQAPPAMLLWACARCPQNLWGFSSSGELLIAAGSASPRGQSQSWRRRDYLAKELCGRGKQRRLQDFSLGRG